MKRTYCHEVNDEQLRQTIISELYDKAYAIATSGTMKHEREEKFNALEAEFAARYSEEELAEKAPLIHKYFHDDVQKKAMRNMILDEGKRLDGRKTDEIRPIWCEVESEIHLSVCLTVNAVLLLMLRCLPVQTAETNSSPV